ncbi:MAG: intermembrane transport protein PqiB [Gammaproteobacteria bacterium]|nr:intermembrane transport protein PqiB [Gammaproteobacteria bacterium]
MSSQSSFQQAKADISTHNRVSKVWLIPLVALCIGIWMVADNYYNRGPLISIEFQNAEGLEAGKTRVKTLNVDIGVVQSVVLNAQRNGVIVTARLNPQARDLLNNNSLFWVVKPRIGSGGISGLGTLMSGSYIEFVPGEGAESPDEFVGLEQEPITPIGVPGIRVSLEGNKGKSVSVGDPVTYRGFEVGRVEQSDFDVKKRIVHYQIFIRAPYSNLVTDNTYFWNSSGVSFEASAQGIKVNLGSVESLISGGVTFDVPDDLPLGEPIENATIFNLYPDKDSVYEQRKYQFKEFVVLFKDSVRGLSPGAPIEYRGIRIGTVTDISLSLISNSDVESSERRIPVVIRIEPARVGMNNDLAAVSAIAQQMDTWVAQGLKATLKTGSLLTGSLFVDLDFYPVDQDSVIGLVSNKAVIPSVSGSLAQIEQKVFAILDKFEQMPIDVTIDNINQMLSSANVTMGELKKTVAGLNTLLTDKQTQAIPQQINTTLSQLTKMMKSYDAKSPLYGELDQTMNQLQLFLREVRPLIKELNNKPNALIFETQADADPQPKGLNNED